MMVRLFSRDAVAKSPCTCGSLPGIYTTMTDEQKELFEKYTNCMREYQTTTDCLIFQNSFKLGARMMLEVMEDR